MLYLLILIAAACTGVAFYNLICAFKDIPTVRASRIMLNVTREHDSGNLYHEGSAFSPAYFFGRAFFLHVGSTYRIHDHGSLHFSLVCHVSEGI